MKRLILTTALTTCLAAPVVAEMEYSLYLGSQTLPHSRIKGDLPNGGGKYNELVGWNGKPFAMPPYYGARATWWRNNDFGLALEYTHTKAYMPADVRTKLGFSRFEFSDGHNVLTANLMRRWQNRWGNLTPYAGAGLGFAFPHVDASHNSGARTYGFQVTGAAVRTLAGVSYELNDRYSVFSEYQFTFSKNEGTLKGGGTFDTYIKTNAINVGLSVTF